MMLTTWTVCKDTSRKSIFSNEAHTAFYE